MTIKKYLKEWWKVMKLPLRETRGMDFWTRILCLMTVYWFIFIMSFPFVAMIFIEFIENNVIKWLNQKK